MSFLGPDTFVEVSPWSLWSQTGLLDIQVWDSPPQCSLLGDNMPSPIDHRWKYMQEGHVGMEVQALPAWQQSVLLALHGTCYIKR